VPHDAWADLLHIFIFPSVMITLSGLAFHGTLDGLRKALGVSENI
jgi:ABC-type dipeptide/oligopeptide/nickel transport system permease subunit